MSDQRCEFGVNGHFVEVEVKQVAVLTRLVVFQNLQVAFALLNLVLLLLYHYWRVEHVVFLQVEEYIDQKFVGIIDNTHY